VVICQRNGNSPTAQHCPGVTCNTASSHQTRDAAEAPLLFHQIIQQESSRRTASSCHLAIDKFQSAEEHKLCPTLIGLHDLDTLLTSCTMQYRNLNSERHLSIMLPQLGTSNNDHDEEVRAMPCTHVAAIGTISSNTRHMYEALPRVCSRAMYRQLSAKHAVAMTAYSSTVNTQLKCKKQAYNRLLSTHRSWPHIAGDCQRGPQQQSCPQERRCLPCQIPRQCG